MNPATPAVRHSGSAGARTRQLKVAQANCRGFHAGASSLPRPARQAPAGGRAARRAARSYLADGSTEAAAEQPAPIRRFGCQGDGRTRGSLRNAQPLPAVSQSGCAIAFVLRVRVRACVPVCVRVCVCSLCDLVCARDLLLVCGFATSKQISVARIVTCALGASQPAGLPERCIGGSLQPPVLPVGGGAGSSNAATGARVAPPGGRREPRGRPRVSAT